MTPIQYSLGMAAAPEPGIYLGVPFNVYKLWPYPSKSLLGDLQTSPAQFAAKVSGQIKWGWPSYAQIIGSLTDHIWVEQLPVDEAHGWHAGPKDMPTKGKRRDAWLASLPKGDSGYTPTQLDLALAMVAALQNNERADELQANATPQVSLVWDDPDTGIRMKGRPDLIDFDGLVLSDLKTARSITKAGFSKACADYNYHWQLHLYTTGLVANGIGAYEDWKQWLIAVRNEPIHGVACRPMGPAALELARAEVNEVLWQLRSCIDAGEWPADHNDEQPITLPGWRFKGRTA